MSGSLVSFFLPFDHLPGICSQSELLHNIRRKSHSTQLVSQLSLCTVCLCVVSQCFSTLYRDLWSRQEALFQIWTSSASFCTSDELKFCSGVLTEAFHVQLTSSRHNVTNEPWPLCSQCHHRLLFAIVLSIRVISRRVEEVLSSEDNRVCLLLMVIHITQFELCTIFSSVYLKPLEFYFPSTETLLGAFTFTVMFFTPRIRVRMSPKATHRRPLLLEIDPYCDGGQKGTTSPKPNLLMIVILGYYGPCSVAGYRGLEFGFNLLVKLSSPIRLIILLIGTFLDLYFYYGRWTRGLDLSLGKRESHIVLIALVQRTKLRQFIAVIGSQVYNLTSLSDEYSRLRESPIVLSLIQRMVIPGRFSTVRRFNFLLESSRPIQAAQWRATNMDSLRLPPSFDSIECLVHLSHRELCCIDPDIHVFSLLFGALSWFSFAYVLSTYVSSFAVFFIVSELLCTI